MDDSMLVEKLVTTANHQTFDDPRFPTDPQKKQALLKARGLRRTQMRKLVDNFPDAIPEVVDERCEFYMNNPWDDRVVSVAR